MLVTAHPQAPTRIMLDPLVGRDIGGRFVLTERIASSSGGVSYRAVQRSVGRDVVIKLVQAGGDPGEVARFLDQARTLGRIAHPNVMEVIDAGVTGDGLLYLVSGMVAGRSLADAVAVEGRLETGRLLRIGLQLCDALEAAHARAIVHGALSPANVMLLPGDSIMVVDFGMPGSGDPALDPRADLYALGLILHELAAGRRLDAGGPTLPHLPRPLAALIDALVAPDPARRPHSAHQVKAELLALSRPPPFEPAGEEATGIILPRTGGAPLARAVSRRRRAGLPLAVQLAVGAGFGLGLGYALTVLAIKALDLL
jgi:serine/threonine protein kinase